MKRILVFAVMLFLAESNSIAQRKVVDANAEMRTVSSFTAINVSNAIDLELTQSDEEALAVSAAKAEYRDRIKTKVENGVLKIWYDDEDRFWKNSGNKKLKAYVSFRTLNKLTASGASDVNVTGTIKSGNFQMNLSGASDFKGALEVRSLDLDLSGASDAQIVGSASELKIQASGASDFKGFDFTIDNCNAEATGASDIKITVNKELNARASGASSIQYRGNGVIRDLKSGGASSVSRRG